MNLIRNTKNRVYYLACVAIVCFFMNILFIQNIQAANELSLYGTILSGNGSTFVKLNPDTGALIETIGEVGYKVNGLAEDKATNKMYGCTSSHDPNYFGLIEINIETGAGTPVNANGWNIDDPDNEYAITNITVNFNGEMYAWVQGFDDLVRINKITGTKTRIGESNLSTYANGLDFNSSDILYIVNGDEGEYYELNTATGAANYIGSLGETAHHGAFHPTTNIWYGVNNYGGAGERSLVLADLSTGTVTNTLPTVDNFHTLAFYIKRNIAPQFSHLNTTAIIPKMEVVTIDANVSLEDINLDLLNNYDGAIFSISRNGGSNADDIFGSTGNLGVLNEGNALTLNGTDVGTVTTNSNGTLTLAFNANATSGRVDEVIRSITYFNEELLPRSRVQLNYSLNDGNTGEQGDGGAKTDTAIITLIVEDFYSLPTLNEYGFMLFALILMMSAMRMMQTVKRGRVSSS
ncbi:MAG: hypothetical protein HQK75_11840 [Candidatus Magnetomorum sp.]|nr:hypothetical protein [Candidatus Magnetomorum sp.]